jgi:hypothetical protein
VSRRLRIPQGFTSGPQLTIMGKDKDKKEKKQKEQAGAIVSVGDVQVRWQQ